MLFSINTTSPLI